MADPDRAKPNLCSNPSQKVRIVAKLRGLTEQESGSLNGSSTPLISVRKPDDSYPSDKVTISFGEQPASRKDAFEVDYCYEQDEDVGLIYSREVKPLISRVLNGQNVSIIAYGARGSGKTYTIQGCEERPGLLMLAMADALSLSEEVGKLVKVSFYEVFQDHVYDLLDSRRCEVQILEDAHGKIKLKGLSEVPVKSISEFHKLLYSGPHKPVQKIPLEPPRRSHKGAMIRILSCDEKLNTKACKMNFVDLAGYEDARRNSSDGISLAESTRINKSLYSLMNVVYALNANESRVPYRESKLTRMLQDSLGGANFVLMLTCLNPVLWQDTMYTLSLASRSCQSISRVMDSTIKSKSSAKPLVPSSFKCGKSASSFKSGKFRTVSATIKKEMTRSRVLLHDKKPSSMVKGRKLFDDGKDMISSEQDTSISDVSPTTTPKKDETLLASAIREAEPTTEEEGGTFFSSAIKETEPTTKDDKDGFQCTESNHVEVTSGIDTDRKALVLFEDGCGMGKENKILMNEDGSPPLSVRLQELSNNMKSLYSSTPLCVERPQMVDISGQVVCTDLLEPKTPVVEEDVRVNDKWQVVNFSSPLTTYSKRSSGMKNSLVHNYLQFLNSASKEELKGIKGIGEKRATYILELREESPEPFKSLEDLQDIGLSEKQVTGMMKRVAGEIFS